ncbi:hypothetical protein I7I53_03854 [Histoplasma capsulatum var. duboisii H88]|uniref:Uncharacterized protein n=1 Tax=Ajellomyces capsulatus (strain H88) TaxID=544711 RepID=A0A8A1LNJ0_AJEC8|nr:hypothetical protein I7I53_03854 [Histoplasma capsulatum var. duboisii H88]
MTTSTTQPLTYFSASSVTSFSDWLRFRARVANAEGQPRPSSSRCSPSPSRFISRGLGFSCMYVQHTGPDEEYPHYPSFIDRYRRIFDPTNVAYPLPLHVHFLPASNLYAFRHLQAGGGLPRLPPS